MIHIEEVAIQLGEFQLRDVNLAIESGEYMVLLGPTGAGKSVLLECLVGLHRPQAGRIRIDERDIVGLDPEQRRVGFVPQDYALFPNMTVRRNLEYGLRARRLPAEAVQQRSARMLKQLRLDHLVDRLPLNLSGGEKQRVALGRALVTEPEILLLDEPLSALDESLRSDLARQLRRIQQEAGASFLHVCHSLEEASEVGDRVAIMDRGTIVQVGTIEEILMHPANLFVAGFTRTRNLLRGVAEKVGNSSRIRLDGGSTIFSRCSMEGPVVVGIRPEEVMLRRTTEAAADRIDGTVMELSLRPQHVEVMLDIGVALVAYQSRSAAEVLAVGQKVAVEVAPQRVVVFEAASPGALADRDQGG